MVVALPKFRMQPHFEYFECPVLVASPQEGCCQRGQPKRSEGKALAFEDRLQCLGWGWLSLEERQVGGEQD